MISTSGLAADRHKHDDTKREDAEREDAESNYA